MTGRAMVAGGFIMYRLSLSIMMIYDCVLQ